MRGVKDPADAVLRLAETGYLADAGLGTATFLSIAMNRPLLLEGEPGSERVLRLPTSFWGRKM
jgi:MoxR-like ATPase